jgi:hypothetical protein
VCKPLHYTTMMTTSVCVCVIMGCCHVVSWVPPFTLGMYSVCPSISWMWSTIFSVIFQQPCCILLR